MDYYKVLGVAYGATAEDITAAYRRAAFRHHPDRGGSETTMQAVNLAYAQIMAEGIDAPRFSRWQSLARIGLLFAVIATLQSVGDWLGLN